MKKYYYILILFLFFSCNEESPINEPSDPEIENSQPFDFDIAVLEIGHNYVVINWGPVYDIEDDPLQHSVYLGDSLFASNLVEDHILKIDNLHPETDYTVKVVVTDQISEPVSNSITFTTAKYYLQFDRIYAGENGNKAIGYNIEKADDGGYFIFGQSKEMNRDALFMLKTDSLGFEMWHKFFNSKTSFLKVEVYKDVKDFFIVHGQSISKVGYTGDLKWQYHSNNDFTLEYTGICLTSADQILITGNGSLNYDQTGTLSKISNTGELVWEKYVSHDEETVVENIIKTSDDHYVIIGSSWYGYKDAELFISKIDENGDMIWLKRHGNGFYDFPKYILETEEGNGFIYAGDNWGDRDVSSIRILFINQIGDLQFEKYYKWDSFKTHVKGLISTSDGGIAFTGSAGYTPQNGILVKLDSQGDLMWRMEYKPDYMDYQWSGFDLKQTNDDGFVFCGFKGYLWAGEGKEIGLWIKKTNDKGE